MFLIYPDDVKEDSKEDEIFYRLRHGIKASQKDIYLMACDKNGDVLENGVIISLDYHVNGLILHNDISSKIPLKTDLNGSLLTITSGEYAEMLLEGHRHKMYATIQQEMEKQLSEESPKH